MKTLSDMMHQVFDDAIKKSFPELSSKDFTSDVTVCQQENLGHYQCNDALKLSKILKKNPRDIAKEIVANIDNKKIFSKIDIAGPGFINVTLSNEFLSSEVDKILRDYKLGAKIEKRKKIIVEFSSPNIAKELHVGHLRSTIIGDSIARLFEFLDQEVIRLNHIGDWGTQFGMLISYLKETKPKVLSGEEKTDLSSLMQWYKESKKKFDTDPEFQKKSQLEVVKLQSHDKEAIHAWKIICDISRKAFNEIYDLLDVKIKERGESFYNPVLKDIVDDLMEKKIATISDGAKCVFLEGFKNREGNPLPVIVQKRDGGFNYSTTDLAAFRNRCQDEKADRIIILTDIGQSLHFQMVYQVAVLAKYIDPDKTEFNHVSFGLVLGPDGKKFKTRSGETEKLSDLLYQAIDRSKKILKERMENVTDKEIDEYSKILGIDAVKYADLSSHRQKDYQFSYDNMLKFEGNTAPFLLYSYVRINGIEKKTKANMEEVVKNNKIELEHPSEVDLGLHLRRFAEVLEMFAKELLPNRLCDYLYNLAEKFNAFFRDCRVEGDAKEKQRLVLCEATKRVLEKGLDILGMKTLPRM